MNRDARDSGVSLAELLAAFSFAMDLSLGQPMEHVLRSHTNTSGSRQLLADHRLGRG